MLKDILTLFNLFLNMNDGGLKMVIDRYNRGEMSPEGKEALEAIESMADNNPPVREVKEIEIKR